jgi:hypothetical protein
MIGRTFEKTYNNMFCLRHINTGRLVTVQEITYNGKNDDFGFGRAFAS